MQAPVVIHHYDPVWPELYARERARLEALLGARLAAIAHIGSTAVPGLAAKPIIDVLAGVHDLAADGPPCVEALVGAGWVYEPAHEAVLPARRYFSWPGSRDDAFHLHLVEVDSPFWVDHLLFRDHLRAHPRAALVYQQIKHVLVARSADRQAYTAGKAGFVDSILALARAERA